MEKLMENKIVKMNVDEYVKYFEEMGLSESECLKCLENEYKVPVQDIKYIFSTDIEYSSYYEEGIQTTDDRYLFQGDGAGRLGIWGDPKVLTYDKLIEYLLIATE